MVVITATVGSTMAAVAVPGIWEPGSVPGSRARRWSGW
jgi:hypothetical protein